MKKVILAMALSLSVASCAELNMVRGMVGAYGQEASDAAVHDAVWTLCKASPVGAVKRKFSSAEEMATYNKLCSADKQLTEGS